MHAAAVCIRSKSDNGIARAMPLSCAPLRFERHRSSSRVCAALSLSAPLPCRPAAAPAPTPRTRPGPRVHPDPVQQSRCDTRSAEHPSNSSGSKGGVFRCNGQCEPEINSTLSEKGASRKLQLRGWTHVVMVGKQIFNLHM